jgi:hypothetical protein
MNLWILTVNTIKPNALAFVELLLTEIHIKFEALESREFLIDFLDNLRYFGLGTRTLESTS